MATFTHKSMPDVVAESLATIILVAAAFAALIASIIVVRDSPGAPAEKLELATGYALLIFLFFLSMTVLLDIVRNKMDLSDMLEELSGGASMSRFQLLIFTFVFAFSFFVVVARAGQFPEIPQGVLTMLGISASTYAVSKGLQVASGQVEGKGDDSVSPAPNGSVSKDPTVPKATPNNDVTEQQK